MAQSTQRTVSSRNSWPYENPLASLHPFIRPAMKAPNSDSDSDRKLQTQLGQRKRKL